MSKLTDDEFKILLKIKQEELTMMKHRGYESDKIFSTIGTKSIKFNKEDDPFVDFKLNVKKMRELREKGFFNFREDFTADYYLGSESKPTRICKVIYVESKTTLENKLKRTREKVADTGVDYITYAMAMIAKEDENPNTAGGKYDEIVIIIKNKFTSLARSRIDSWLVNKSILTDNEMLIPIFNHAFGQISLKYWKSRKEFEESECISRKYLPPLSAKNQAICKRLGLQPGNVLMTYGFSPIGGREVKYYRITN